MAKAFLITRDVDDGAHDQSKVGHEYFVRMRTGVLHLSDHFTCSHFKKLKSQTT